MALRFTFRETPLTIRNAKDADPNEIGRALDRIATENGGRLTKRTALDAARNRRHVMHKHVEWRDAVAAEAYRLEQVSEIIRLIVREDDEDEDKPQQRYFHSIHDSEGTAYRTVDEILGSRQLRLALMLSAERDLASWQKRYDELSDICDLVRSARDQLRRQIDDEKGEGPRPRA